MVNGTIKTIFFDEMAGNVEKIQFICFHFQKTFHYRDVFCTLSRIFVRLWLRPFVLAVHYFAIFFSFRGFNKLTSTAKSTTAV